MSPFLKFDRHARAPRRQAAPVAPVLESPRIRDCYRDRAAPACWIRLAGVRDHAGFDLDVMRPRRDACWMTSRIVRAGPRAGEKRRTWCWCRGRTQLFAALVRSIGGCRSRTSRRVRAGAFPATVPEGRPRAGVAAHRSALRLPMPPRRNLLREGSAKTGF
jgi:hypothetical protein